MMSTARSKRASIQSTFPLVGRERYDVVLDMAGSKQQIARNRCSLSSWTTSLPPVLSIFRYLPLKKEVGECSIPIKLPVGANSI